VEALVEGRVAQAKWRSAWGGRWARQKSAAGYEATADAEGKGRRRRRGAAWRTIRAAEPTQREIVPCSQTYVAGT
jgi:hypothetical protein